MVVKNKRYYLLALLSILFVFSCKKEPICKGISENQKLASVNFSLVDANGNYLFTKENASYSSVKFYNQSDVEVSPSLIGTTVVQDTVEVNYYNLSLDNYSLYLFVDLDGDRDTLEVVSTAYDDDTTDECPALYSYEYRYNQRKSEDAASGVQFLKKYN